jgi:peptidyl-dipeptidase A
VPPLRVCLLAIALALVSVAVISAQSASPEPNLDEARAFIARAEAEMLDRWIAKERAAWVQATYITHDTDLIAARATAETIASAMRLARESTRFDGLELPPELGRKLELLRRALTLPAPDDPAQRQQLTEIMAAMKGRYGTGEYCPDSGDECLDLGELSRRMASSRDPGEMLELWTGWRTVSPPMRTHFERYVELANQGAHELGHADVGAMWRSKYDMDPDAFAAEVDRLWLQVKPLYDALHCYVRSRLAEAYGEELVALDQPIPAHLLGNMWAQEWSALYPMLAPVGADPGFDLTQLLNAKGIDEREMVRIGERFFVSLGFDPLPATFWERSMFSQPPDRDVVCHASAWDIDFADDLRLKMCIEINAEDFVTVHHELGHNYYYWAYSQQPPLFREGANDGFHEAIGDTLALSITPAYLVQLGLLEREPDASGDIGLLLRQALDRVAFLPFGILVDQYRWRVFSGEIGPDRYNSGWWKLREHYQGVRAPVKRSEADFDPGAKYHVAANVPYTRYFLGHILQYQLHRALCQAADHEGPLHRCSIYGNAEAGARLAAMLAMGQSQPWPDALETVSGQRELDATAILDYYAPLKEWLDRQNRGLTCGW